MIKFKITLIKSLIGCSDSQIRTARALGLRKIGQQKILNDTPAFRGQVRKVQHLITINRE